MKKIISFFSVTLACVIGIGTSCKVNQRPKVDTLDLFFGETQSVTLQSKSRLQVSAQQSTNLMHITDNGLDKKQFFGDNTSQLGNCQFISSNERCVTVKPIGAITNTQQCSYLAIMNTNNLCSATITTTLTGTNLAPAILRVNGNNVVPYQSIGVTYNGLHATTQPTPTAISADIQTISTNTTNLAGQSFSAIRTYYPQYNGGNPILMNIIPSTMNVLLGLYLFDFDQPAHPEWTQENLQNDVLPYLSNSNLTGVLVGNEDATDGSGNPSNANITTIITYINQIKTQNPQTRVSSAQTTGFWNNSTNPDVISLSNKCDFIAVNIYPDWNWQSPDANNQPKNALGSTLSVQDAVTSFIAQYQKLVSLYPNKQIVVSETGWPTTYGWVVNVQPPIQYQIGLTNATAYFNQIQDWAKRNNVVVYYYSMFDDWYGVNTSSQYNMHFGLLDNVGNPKHASP